MKKTDTPIVVPAGLEARKPEFSEYLAAAKLRLEKFAGQYGWQYLTDKTFVDSWEIYDDKRDFDRRICELAGVATDTKLPATYSGALERRVLVTVTPGLYLANYPQGDEPEAFAKLLCHEMAHRLHIRILDGNEEAMGPVWFYEGFALFAAGQFADSYQPLAENELLGIFAESERGDYRRYAHAFRQLAGRVESFQDFLTWPAKEDFMQRLKRLLENG